MKTLTLSMFTLVGLVGHAVAAPSAGAPAPPATPPVAARMVAPVPPAQPPVTAAPMTPLPLPDALVKAGAMMAGTWKCKGTHMLPTGASMPMTGTNKVTVESDKWWIHDSFTAPMGKASFHFESYTTFDPTAKLWKRVMVMNEGGWMTGSAKDDPAKQDWDMTTDGPHGQAMFRDHVDTSDMKTGVKMWGEASMDHGKTWMKAYEQTCKK